MGRSRHVERRAFLTSLGAAAAGAGIGQLPLGRALAGGDEPALTGANAAPAWRKLQELTQRASQLGLGTTRMALGPVTQSGNFEDVMPAIVDFTNRIDATSRSIGPTADSEALIEEATNLAISVERSEHLPSAVLREIDDDVAPRGIKVKSLETLKPEYEKLFATMKINSGHGSIINWSMKQILDNKARYQKVEDAVCVPWFSVAILHGMEASFNFFKHLHNGDSLKARTWQVPKGRPPTWNPPTDWEYSAADAMQVDKLDDKTDWSLAAMLYRWEGYNGWGYRGHGINTPYLWSYTNHYTSGKYTADSKWSSSAVSGQCGAAVMLKMLIDKGEIAFS